jgi:ABC-2 type transport system ATP-binding protein
VRCSKTTYLSDHVVLATRDLTRSYGDLVAVDHLSIEVHKGELLALLGPNGAGKTTLMRLLCGVLRPDEGEVTILGASGRELRRVQQQRVGYCPQTLIVWRELTCLEQLVFMADMYRLPRSEARRQASGLLETLGLSDKANVLAGRLSGGMTRRLNLALALIHDPDVLILDEPAAGLDPQSRVLVREVIACLAREQGKAIIVSTHDMDEAERLSDRVAIQDHGRLIALDRAEVLKTRGGETGMLEVALPGETDLGMKAALDAVRTAAPSATRAEDAIVLPGEPEAGLLDRVRGALRDRGIEPGEIRVRRRTLEDVFLDLTGRRLRD